MNIRRKTRLSLLVLAAILCFLIVCPLIMIFAKAVITDGRLDFYCAWQTLTESENAVMIGSSLLLGVLVVLLSTLIAAPLAYLFSKTCFARYRAFDIIFMIPFMTPPYIASMGWILFMQKRGLLQQLFPAAAGCENWFFSLGGLVLVMSLHVFPFMLTMLKNAILFSGDYTETTQVYAFDPIRGQRADMAVLDCAYGYDQKSYVDACVYLVSRVCRLMDTHGLVVFPVPKYGRGLELLRLLHGAGVEGPLLW